MGEGHSAEREKFFAFSAFFRGKPSRRLARHYGFTAEELDFILNYDIKYRLGRDTENEEQD